MQAQFMGYRIVNFLNDEGQQVTGSRIYTAFKEENVEGFCTADFFLKEGINLPKDIKLNDKIDIIFNRKGKVEMICKVN